MPKHRNVKPSFAIYDACNDEFVSPLCTTIEALQIYLKDLDTDAAEGDYVILQAVESNAKLSKAGWSLE